MAVLKKSKKASKQEFSEKEIAVLGREYAEISAQIKQLDSRKKELATLIKEGAEKYGVQDDKGSYYLESDDYIMGKTAKKSFKIDQDKAVEKLESLGLGDVVDVVTTKVVNEDKLNKAVQSGRLPMETVEEFTNISVSYSVMVKEKEEAPEVEQSSLKVARRK